MVNSPLRKMTKKKKRVFTELMGIRTKPNESCRDTRWQWNQKQLRVKVENQTVPGQNSNGWSSVKKGKRKKKGKKRVSRQGWKRHQKIRETMENQGPNWWGKSPLKQRFPLSQTLNPQLGVGQPAPPQEASWTSLDNCLLPLLWHREAWFSSAVWPGPSLSNKVRWGQLQPQCQCMCVGGVHMIEPGSSQKSITLPLDSGMCLGSKTDPWETPRLARSLVL